MGAGYSQGALGRPEPHAGALVFQSVFLSILMMMMNLVIVIVIMPKRFFKILCACPCLSSMYV